MQRKQQRAVLVMAALAWVALMVPEVEAKKASMPAFCHFNSAIPYQSDPCIAETAATFYEYAILAILAYKRSPDEEPNQVPRLSDGLTLPSGFTERPDLVCKTTKCANPPGFQYSVFERVLNGRPVELVIAFRGSDERVDWLSTNFGLGRRARLQRWAALATYQRIAALSDLPISVVGDSLGGALAAQVALCHPTYRRVILDSSPRFRRSDCNSGAVPAQPADIFLRNQLFYERGEALQYVRSVTNRPTQLETRFNCIGGWNPVKQHAGARLAACVVRRGTTVTENTSVKTYYQENISIFNQLLSSD